METPPFIYQPGCTQMGCDRPATLKVAAAWSDGTSRELKTYGLACGEHADEMLAESRAKCHLLHPAEGESVEEPELFQLLPGVRDRELSRVG